ncbi:hypothetical protein KR093_003013, partial [Drosophila rubida]
KMSFALDAESLERLTFERSKIWSNILKNYEGIENGEALDVQAFDELFAHDDDTDEEESMNEYEEAEEDEVEDDINNTTQCMTKAELTQVVNSGSNKQILDQTIPIVEGHLRKWKEAGLDRILNTFDAHKIEEHVGGWMRRNNSCYSDKTLSPPTASTSKSYYKRYYQSADLNDSDEETAHYIRNSCKRSASKCKSPRTSVKMYRTLSSKRTNLRAKYACQLSEEQHHHHMQTLLQRRKELQRRQRERELIFHTSPRHYSCSMVHKRRDVSRLLPASSSSEDEMYQHSLCDCASCTAKSAFSKSVAHPYYSAYRRKGHSRSLRDYHHHREPRFELESRSFSSNVYCKRNMRHQLQRQHAFEQDRRPRLIENECGCCNNERLCSKVVHLANSSTEDWVVENKSSPDALPFETPKKSSMSATRPKATLKMSATRSKVSTKAKSRAVEEDVEFELTQPTFSSNSNASNKTKMTADDELVFEQPKTIYTNSTKAKLKPVEELEFEQQKPTCSTTKSKTKAAVTFSQVDVVPSTPKSSTKPRTQKSTKKEALTTEDIAGSFVSPPKSMRKQKVRSTSKKEKPGTSVPTTPVNHNETTKALYTIDEVPIMPEKPNPKDKTAKASKQKKPSTQTTKKGTKTSRAVKKQNTQHEDELSELDEELKRALVLSKETYAKESVKLEQRAIDEVKTESPQLPEQSMFNNHSVACNSTALTNDTACNRALKPQKTANPLCVFDSKICIDLCSPESSRPVSEADNDCTMVTSTTTGCETVAADVAAASERPQLKISKKGVLLYEPQKSNLNNSTANFTLSERVLSPIIGSRKARRFFKYYTGNCSFDSRYYVYYCPPSKLLAALSSDSKSIDLDSSSTSDCEDDLEIIASLGVIHTEIGDD